MKYKSKESNVFQAISGYRHLQLLANLSNSVQQRGLIPILILEATTAFGVSLAFLVKTPVQSENVPVLILMFLIYVNCSRILSCCSR